MISKAIIKDIRSLHLQKFRQIYNKFVVEGGKACAEFIKTEKFKIEAVYLTENSIENYKEWNGSEHYTPEVISQKEMGQISALKTPSDILMVVEREEEKSQILAKSGTSAIYLDDVQDPGNVGTIIRLADWFGIDAVIRSPNSADFFNPKVVQATMGSMVNMHLITADLQEVCEYNKNIIGTYMQGAPIHEIKLPKDAILVMGNEGKGISCENEKFITNKVSIPGANSRLAESLNVAIAAGIICSFWKKQ